MSVAPGENLSLLTATPGRFLLLYGSQTGQAQAISEEIYENCQKYGLRPELHCLSLTEKKFCLERETCVVFVCSTTGDGDVPDTASKFTRRLKKRTLPNTHLQNLRYTLLGLGDSNYTNFCNGGKTINKRLEELGARKFYECGWGDDAVGLEVAVEPWMEGLYPALCRHLGLEIPESEHIEKKDQALVEKKDQFDRKGDIKKITLNGSKTNDERIIKEESDLDRIALPADNHREQTLTESSDYNDIQADKDHDIENGTALPIKDGMESEKMDQVMSDQSDGNCGVKREAVEPLKEIETSSSEVTQENLLQKFKDHSNSQSNNQESGTTKQKGNESEMSKKSGKTEPSVHKNPACDIEDGSVSEQTSPVVPSLTVSVPPLSEKDLSVPSLPQSFIEVEFLHNAQWDDSELQIQNGCPMPSATSGVTMATLVSASRLTRGDAVKTALDIELDISGTSMNYEPGDTFGVVCTNDVEECDKLIDRLLLSEMADVPFKMTLKEGTKKKLALVPPYLPNPCTVRHALVTGCDIRAAPKKAFLHLLAEFTTDESQKRRLLELSSREGAQDYALFIRESKVTFYDILLAFPACKPPWNRVLEHLPRLQGRPYSCSSSPLFSPGRLHFVFNIIEFPSGAGRREARQGVCTGWLNRITEGYQRGVHEGGERRERPGLEMMAGDRERGPEFDEMQEGFQKMRVTSLKIPIYQRSNQYFHLPLSVETPVIMIGPGTGVAPFIGFLQHRAELKKTLKDPSILGAAWLFFGCRHRDRDYLYRDQLGQFVQNGTLTKLVMSFSRDSSPDGAPVYVQDNLGLHAKEVLNLLDHQGAVVYVCGDAKNMAKNVNEKFLEIIQKEKGVSLEEARAYLMDKRQNKMYLEDIWS